jgi:hypothetical protein
MPHEGVPWLRCEDTVRSVDNLNSSASHFLSPRWLMKDYRGKTAS